MPKGIYKHHKHQGFQKGNQLGKANKGKKGHSPWSKGLTKEIDKRLVKMGELSSKRNKGNKYGVGKHWKLSEETKKKMRGNKNNWQGGITTYERKLFLNGRRRVLKLSAEGSHTFEEWEKLKKQCSYICLSCKKQESEIKLTEDHIVPLSKGGSDYIENIQPLCRSCNCKKHNKIIKYEYKL